MQGSGAGARWKRSSASSSASLKQPLVVIFEDLHWIDDGKVEYTPIGHTANLASRLQTIAPAGSIAVSEHTRRLVEGYFELRALGPTAVKGISEAIEVYEV